MILLFILFSRGQLRFIYRGIIKRLNSEITALGLKRDLHTNFENPDTLIELKVRLYKTSDSNHFTDENHNLGIVKENIQNCYVATNDEDTPCFRVWLMGNSQNQKIKSFFKGNFPILKKDEALLESVFTLPKFRGKHIMPAAISMIAKKGTEINARYIMAFVDVKNIKSLKGFKHSGFYPYLLRKEKWFFFMKKVDFIDAPEELITKYKNLK